MRAQAIQPVLLWTSALSACASEAAAGTEVVLRTAPSCLTLASLQAILLPAMIIALLLLCAWLLYSNVLLRRKALNGKVREGSADLDEPSASGRAGVLELEQELTVAIHEAALEADTLHELCEAAADRIAPVLRFPAVVVYLQESEVPEITRAVACGLSPALDTETNPASASDNTLTFLLQAIHTRCAEHVSNLPCEIRVPELAQAAGEAGLGTAHLVPLISGNVVEGLLLAFAGVDGTPEPRRLRTLGVLGRELAHALRLKRIEYRLRHERRKLNDVLKAMGDGVLIIDSQLRVLWSSEHGDDVVAGSARPPGDICYKHLRGRDGPCPDCPAVTALSSGRLEIGEVQVASPDRGHRWYQVTAAPLKDHAGEVQQLIVLSHDVTERHLLKQRLIWSDRLSAVGELIAGVAHELNNPLAAVLGFSELLLAGDVPESIRQDLVRVHKEAGRCRKIVQNLLSFARRAPAEKHLVNINELIRATLELTAYQLQLDNVTVCAELNRQLPPTMADGQQLQQVFLNVINNAHDAIRDKGMPGTLTVSTRRSDNRILVRFTDTGCGIRPRDLQRIFDPFYTTKEVGEGTGLGLSLAYGIVKEHNGDIHVDSAVGKGTSFTMELPILECPEYAKPDEEAGPEQFEAGREL